MIDFSVFRDSDNLLFILIYFLIFIIAVAALIFIVLSVYKFIKKIVKNIFKKDEDSEYVQRLDIAVSELEKSKKEREKVEEKGQEFEKNPAYGPKMQYANIKKNEEENRPFKNKKQIFDEKGKKDIEGDLDALKKTAKGKGKADDSVFSKIKIPKAKKFTQVVRSEGKSDGGGATVVSKNAGEKNSDLYEEEKEVLEKNKSISNKDNGSQNAMQQNKTEVIKNTEIKIPQAASNLGRAQVAREALSKISGDSSIFGGKSEISRIELRQKLRYDPKIWKAQRDAGLYNLDRATRAKLEKDIFPTVYGRNISKTDLKWNLKRMGKEWASTTDMNKKAIIRKEIKFLKKIGGIK